MTVIPRELRINVTAACNLACRGCSKRDAGHGETLALDQTTRLIDRLQATGRLQSLSITGGEPLMDAEREKTFAIIRHAKSLSLHVRLCTNGCYLQADVVDELKKLGVDRVQVGLDSPSRFFHNFRARSRTAWEDATRGIEAVADAGLQASVRFTLYRSNLHDITGTYRLAARLGAAHFKLRTLFPSGAAVENCLGLVPSGQQLAFAQYQAICESWRSAARLELSQPCFFKPGNGYDFDVEDNSSCGESDNASISPAGVIQYCLLCDDGTHFGNVAQGDFVDLWNAPEVAAIRQARKRHGRVVGCPAFQVQYERHIGDYISVFEQPLVRATCGLEGLLARGYDDRLLSQGQYEAAAFRGVAGHA